MCMRYVGTLIYLEQFLQEAQAELICLRDESDAVKDVTWEEVGTGSI
jgi:hypothetical protein